MRGTEFYNIGIDYKYRLRRLLFLGETARSKNGGLATLNSLQYSWANGYRVILLHRYYTHDYWAMFARSFSEGGYVQNENGLYAAFEGYLIRYWQFFASVDFFAFPWLKYGIDKPSYGFDALMQLSYSPRKDLAMTLRYRYKQKEKNHTEGKEKDVRPLHRHQLRYRLKYTPTDYLALRTTVDYNQVYPQNISASQGVQLTQTVSCAFQPFPVKLELQGAYFHTDDYESRVYLSEKGMIYSFYIPSFYGKGSRIMTHLRYDFHKNGMIIAKFGQTTYYDRDKIGSGTDVIPDNKKLDLQMQVRLKF
jgi:hypothetical protein